MPRTPPWRVRPLGVRPTKAHKKKSNEISESPLDSQVSQGHPAGVPANLPFSVTFSKVNNRKFLGRRPGAFFFLENDFRIFFVRKY